MFFLLFQSMSKIYEKEVTLIYSDYIQDTQKFIWNIMQINKSFSLKLQEFYFHDFQLPPGKQIKTEDGKIIELSPEFLLVN